LAFVQVLRLAGLNRLEFEKEQGATSVYIRSKTEHEVMALKELGRL